MPVELAVDIPVAHNNPCIDDDEALLLYAVVRGLRMSRVLEIGGLSGYSAKNFLQAMTPTKGVVYTVRGKLPLQQRRFCPTPHPPATANSTRTRA